MCGVASSEGDGRAAVETPSWAPAPDDLSDLAQELARTRELLRTAQEDERQRIAVELHDSTGQYLAALGLGLSRLRRVVRGDAALRILDEMSGSLQEAVKETRVLAYLMKPHGLAQDGLEKTADDFVQGFAIRTGLETQFETEGPVDAAPEAVQHAALRVMQEALANAYRHAKATAVRVRLSSNEGRLRLQVDDDGAGLRPAARGGHGPVPGVGLCGMRARVAQLAGEFQIQSSPAGTMVQASLPLS